MTEQPLWLVQEAADLPSNHDWLSSAERDHLASLEIERRRRDWLLGRWTAKQTLLSASVLDRLAVDHPSRLEILPAEDGSPRIRVSGVPFPIFLSLSHRAGQAFCCIWTGGRVGCDLELVEPRSRAFIEDYFTTAERTMIEGAGSEGATVAANGLWSAKESVLKLLQVGLTVDARLLEIQETPGIPASEWQQISVMYSEISCFFPGWWCRRGDWILTVATEEQTGPPLRLSNAKERGRVPAP